MLHPFSDFPAHAANLRRVSRVDVNHSKPSAFGLVGNEVLELPESPPVQPRPDTLPRLDAGANVGQVFHANLTCTGTDSLCDDGLTGFVVDCLDMPLLTTGDSPQLSLGSATTIGLKTTTMGKELVAVVPQLPATPDLASAGSGEIIFTNVNPDDTTTGNWRSVWKFDGEIEIPDTLAEDQICFFGQSRGKQIALMPATDEGNLCASVKREQRQHIGLDRVGALVEVDRRGFEDDGRNGLVFDDALVGLERLIGVRNTVDGLAHHLTSKCRERLAHRVIGQMVQCNAVPAAVLGSKRNNFVTRLRVDIGKRNKRIHLFGGCNQLEGYRSNCHIGKNMLFLNESQEQQPSVALLSSPA